MRLPSQQAKRQEHFSEKGCSTIELAITKGEFVQPGYKDIGAIGRIALGHNPYQWEGVKDVDDVQNQRDIDEWAE